MAKKPATQLTDKELLRRLFSKEVRKALKQTVLKLEREKKSGQERKKR